MTIVIAVFVAALIFALIGTPAVRRLALRLGLIAMPRADRAHTEPTAKMGGVAICLGASLALIVGGVMTAWFLQSWGNLDELAAILAGALLMGVVGLWDDRVRLKPLPKLLLQVAAAMLPILAGVRIQLSFLPEFLNLVATLGWILFVTNAINLSDNMDGVAAGISTVTSAFFTLIAAMNGQYLVSALAAATMGASLGFLKYNLPLPRASIFMGDAGAYFLGYMLAILGIKLRFPANVQFVTWMVPVLVLGVPAFDVTMVFISRLRRRISPLRGGIDHSSHRLARLGLGPLGATLSLDLISGTLGMIAVFVMQASLVEGYAVGLMTLALAGYSLYRLEWRLPYELRTGQPSVKPPPDSLPADPITLHAK